MRVKSLHVENLLTFGTFDLCLDGRRHVIVGPNGAGKSNIVRAIDLVQKALDSVSEGRAGPRFTQAADRVLRSFAAARHHGETTGRDAVVRLAVEFTTAAERVQLGTYVRAAILHTLIQEIGSGDGTLRLALAQWVEDEVTDERLSSLFSGAVVLRHAGMPQVPWEISYEFSHGGADYVWLSPGVTSGIVRAGSQAARLVNTPRQLLMHCLLGMQQAGGAPNQLPSPLPGFDLGKMCPAPAAAVTEPTIHTGTGIIDQQFAPFRHRAARAAHT